MRNGAAAGPPIRVLVVDDSVTVRAGVRRLLEAAGLQVVGEADHGAAALRLLPAARPDVAVVDLAMPVLDGVATTRELARVAPGVHVLVLSASSEAQDLVDALRAGAAGYILKTSIGELPEAVRAIARGDSPFSAPMARRLAAQVREEQAQAATAPPSSPVALGERECELLSRLARGEDNAQIAAGMFLSPHTVKSAVAALMARIGVANRVQAAVWAVEHGLDDEPV
jgi:DNA-binding NarL/FixJ family response regulator